MIKFVLLIDRSDVRGDSGDCAAAFWDISRIWRHAETDQSVSDSIVSINRNQLTVIRFNVIVVAHRKYQYNKNKVQHLSRRCTYRYTKIN